VLGQLSNKGNNLGNL